MVHGLKLRASHLFLVNLGDSPLASELECLCAEKYIPILESRNQNDFVEDLKAFNLSVFKRLRHSDAFGSGEIGSSGLV